MFMPKAVCKVRKARTLKKASVSSDNLVNYWKEAVASTPWKFFQLYPSQLVAELNAGNSSICIIDNREATDIPGGAGYRNLHGGMADWNNPIVTGTDPEIWTTFNLTSQ